MDSGASTHMCNDKSKFSSLEEDDGGKVYTAIDDCVDSEDKGKHKNINISRIKEQFQP